MVNATVYYHVLFCVFAVLKDKTAALSALLGGLVCILPNAFFARKLFRYQALEMRGK